MIIAEETVKKAQVAEMAIVMGSPLALEGEKILTMALAMYEVMRLATEVAMVLPMESAVALATKVPVLGSWPRKLWWPSY